MLLLAACGGDGGEDTTPPTATLRGALVPTRASLTPTITNTPTATPTDTPTPTSTSTDTATPTPSDTATPTLDATRTAEAQWTLDAQGTQAAEATKDAIARATEDAQEKLNEIATQTAEAELQATLNAQATAERQALLDSQATLNAQIATLNAQSTLSAQATIDAQATFDAQATLNVIATQNAASTATALAARPASPTPGPTESISTLPLPIRYGDSVTGRIEGSTFQREYTFEALAGEVITVDMTAASGDLDPYLSLLDPRGEEIASNDDLDGTTRNSRIESFSIPQTGTYTIVATRFSADLGTTTGDFQLTLTRAGGTTPISTSGHIAYGETVTGEINSTAFEARFTFEGQAGDVINIQHNATSGDLDPFLRLLDATGTELTSNDDDEQVDGTLNSFIHDFPLPNTGTYTIVATRFNEQMGNTAGSFELSLERAGGGGTTTPIGSERFTGEITNQQFSQSFTFEGLAGQVVNIRMNAMSGDLDPLLILQNNQGTELATNDDANDTTRNSLVEAYVLPADGSYTIVATRFNQETGLSEGQFEVLLDVFAAGSISTPVDPNTGVTIQTFEGQITTETFYQLFTFQGEASQVVTISMDATSGDLDPYLLLLDPRGRELARNDDRAEGVLNATLDNILLPTAGEYTIVAARYQRLFGTSTGEFTITLREGTGQPTRIAGLSVDAAVNTTQNGSITNNVSSVVYTFEASAGDKVSVRMAALDDSLDPYLILEDHYGNEIVRNDDNVNDSTNISNAMLDAVLIEADGFYSVVATVYFDSEGNYSTGDFELEITLDEAGQPGADLPTRAVIYNAYTYGDLSDFTIPYYAAGDWLDGTDKKAFLWLTYRLPDLQGAAVENAVINLETCYNPSAFEVFGPLTVYQNATFAGVGDITNEASGSRTIVATINNCQLVDVTDLVRSAYESGSQFIQFQAIFETRDILANNRTDSVIFTNPYLEIHTR